MLVLRFVEGKVFAEEDVRAPQNLGRIVELIGKVHRDLPQHLRGPALIFWVFHVLRDYAHSLQEGKSRHLDKLPTLMATAERLEAAVGAIDLVFGHNDLLAANFNRRRQAPVADRLGLCGL